MSEARRKVMGNERGVALLLAVSVISLLVSVTVQFSKDMRQEVTSSANLLDSARLGVMTKSGYNVGVAVLQGDLQDNAFDTVHDGWANLPAEQMSGLYGGGKLEVVIDDLSGRLQLNSLAGGTGQSGDLEKRRAILKRLLLSGQTVELSEEQAELIIAAIVDWIDADDEEQGIEETESSYYLGREQPYSAKNAPMEFIEELLLVRGVTPELYYGNADFKGLKDLVTVHGNDGKININTAPAAILKALSDNMSDDMVQSLVAFRQEPDNRELLQNVSWYTEVRGIPGDVRFDAAAITTASSYFRLLSRAERSQMVKTLEAVVERRNGLIAMLSRKVQ